MRPSSNRALVSPPAPIPFSLPMMAVFSITTHPDRAVAHALDFDIVAVAPSKEEALAKIRAEIKVLVEFGLKRDLKNDIRFPAPEEFWAALTPESTLSIGEPIEINNQLIRTAYRTISDSSTLDEDRHGLSAA